MIKHRTTSILRHVLFVAVVLFAAMVCVSPVAADGTHEHDGVVFEPWSDSNALPTTGNYYLTCDVTLNTVHQFSSGDCNICLNGHIVTLSEGLAITGATVNLYDCDKSTIYNFTPNEEGLWILNKNNAPSQNNVTGGVITGGSVGVLVQMGVFNLHGGNIVGNNHLEDNGGVGYGGGVYHIGGTFTMSGGSIVGNYAQHNGGGVLSAASRNMPELQYNGFTMSGGYIGENTASKGGGVSIIWYWNPVNPSIDPYIGTMTVSGTAKISGNKAETAPNVYLPEGKTITIGTEGLKDGAKIYVTPSEAGIIAESETDYSKYFYSDDYANHHVVYEDGKIKLADGKTEFTITWMNEGEEFGTASNVEYGVKPTAPEGTPEKTADAQYTYTFDKWTPEIVAADCHATYTADYEKTLNKYTITWKNGDTTLKTESLEYGKVPVYSGEVKPTKEDDEKYTYTFNGWVKEGTDEGITAVTGDATYTAKFIATELSTSTPDEGGSGEVEEPKTEALQPIVPVAPVETEDGETTIVTNAGDDGIKVLEDKKSAEIEAKDVNNKKVATITVSFKEEVAETGETNSVTGEITEVTISYETKPAESVSTGNTDEVEFQMDLTVKTVVTDLPKIDSSIQQNVVESVEEEKPNLNPVAMITATNTDAINAALKEEGSKITLVFTVPKTAIKDVNKIRVLHVDKDGNVNEAKIIGDIVEDPNNSNNWQITAEGTSFSSYVLVEEKTVELVKDSGSSSQGSSVWLTESQTPTETPKPTETATPTDAVPTDIPSTQPTETPDSPAPILGIVAGLGFAVLALRRR